MQRRITRPYLPAVFASILAALLGGAVLAQGTDVGTWKLNVEKSKFSPGPPPRSVTQRVEAAGAGTKVVVDVVPADGTAQHYEYTVNDDGKDNRITGNSPFGDTVARTRLNPTTTQMVFKKDGKVTTTQTSVISADGKTRTDTRKGVNPDGQAVNTTTVWDRQ